MTFYVFIFVLPQSICRQLFSLGHYRVSDHPKSLIHCDSMLCMKKDQGGTTFYSQFTKP